MPAFHMRNFFKRERQFSQTEEETHSPESVLSASIY